LLRVFLGVDPRQPLAYTVLQNSIIRRASKPVSITPLILDQLPIKRKGLTEFTFSRYLPPHLCDYDNDYSVFLDADMLVLCDIYELLDPIEEDRSVHVVKNKQLRFEWPSLMVFQNDLCSKLTPEWIDDPSSAPQSFSWATYGVGELPAELNHCVGYDQPRTDAKIVHFTQGIPCFEETKDCEYAQAWLEEFNYCRASVPWKDIMGNSVHYQKVMERLACKQ